MRNAGRGAGSRDDGGLVEVERKEVERWNVRREEGFVVATRKAFGLSGVRPSAVQRSMVWLSSMRVECGSYRGNGVNMEMSDVERRLKIAQSG